MPSVSKKQQRFFQLVKAVQNGNVKKKDVTQGVKDAAKSMTKKQVSDFADHRAKKHHVKKISEMFPDNFVYERMKINPITRAELDKAKENTKQKNQLFILWPDTYSRIDKLKKFFANNSIDSHIATNKYGQSLFVLKRDIIKTLIDKNLIKHSDDLYIMNPNLTEEDIRNVVLPASDHEPIFDFLNSNNHSRQIFIDDIKNNISWE